ncbi:MAG: hypothetical protein ACLTUN_15130 [Paraclostridium sordellii]|nr:hypothetical protein [Paeniclostridium sordellii]QYE99404.1 hypothetical protein KZ987_07845 [Paeniclostridium sordellii]
MINNERDEMDKLYRRGVFFITISIILLMLGISTIYNIVGLIIFILIYK